LVESKLIYSQLLKKLKSFPDREAKNISLKYMFLKFNITSSDLLLNKKFTWGENKEKSFLNDIDQILKNVPVQYITSSEFFYDSIFYVNKSTLIPRPETEELVNNVIKLERSNVRKEILDIGTGSGCIAITLSNHIKSSVVGIDSSLEAIKVAKKNNFLTPNKVQFIHSKVEEYKPQKFFDVIISNPPYIPKSDIEKVDDIVLKNEPYEALFVDSDPIYFYKIILEFSKKHLKKNGVIYFEINQNYVELIKNLLKEINFEVVKDFYDNMRFVIVKGINK
tara:strand:+ start:541 stop:1377 length:837 start_codon:yes stop_codon:yes gene_type:complete